MATEAEPDFHDVAPADLPKNMEWAGTDKKYGTAEGLKKKWLVHLPKHDSWGWFRKDDKDKWKMEGDLIRSDKTRAKAEKVLADFKSRSQVAPSTPVRGPRTISMIGKTPIAGLSLDITPISRRRGRGRRFSKETPIAGPLFLEPKGLESVKEEAADHSDSREMPTHIAEFPDLPARAQPPSLSGTSSDEPAQPTSLPGTSSDYTSGTTSSSSFESDEKARDPEPIKSRGMISKLMDRVRGRKMSDEEKKMKRARTAKARGVIAGHRGKFFMKKPSKVSRELSKFRADISKGLNVSNAGRFTEITKGFEKQKRSSRLWQQAEMARAKKRWRRMVGWGSDIGPTKQRIY